MPVENTAFSTSGRHIGPKQAEVGAYIGRVQRLAAVLAMC
jgi:hypothetical protein